MRKAELIRKVASDTGVEAVTVSAVLESTMSNIKDALVKDKALYLRGFGTFRNKNRKAKVARNITANTSIIVPEHRIPAFLPCKEFKDAVK